jgi:hypothetical protein
MLKGLKLTLCSAAISASANFAVNASWYGGAVQIAVAALQIIAQALSRSFRSWRVGSGRERRLASEHAQPRGVHQSA